MKLSLSYDPTLDAWTFTHEDCHLRTLGDVRQWEERARALLEQIPIGGVLLVDIEGFSLAPEMGPEWAALLKTLVLPRIGVLLRYGHCERATESAIQIQGLVNRIPAGILPDRSAALTALMRLRARPA